MGGTLAGCCLSATSRLRAVRVSVNSPRIRPDMRTLRGTCFSRVCWPPRPPSAPSCRSISASLGLQTAHSEEAAVGGEVAGIDIAHRTAVLPDGIDEIGPPFSHDPLIRFASLANTLR